MSHPDSGRKRRPGTPAAATRTSRSNRGQHRADHRQAHDERVGERHHHPRRARGDHDGARRLHRRRQTHQTVREVDHRLEREQAQHHDRADVGVDEHGHLDRRAGEPEDAEGGEGHEQRAGDGRAPHGSGRTCRTGPGAGPPWTTTEQRAAGRRRHDGRRAPRRSLTARLSRQRRRSSAPARDQFRRGPGDRQVAPLPCYRHRPRWRLPRTIGATRHERVAEGVGEGDEHAVAPVTSRRPRRGCR